MDTSKYAALFLSDSRENLQQCDTLLLAWEGDPARTEPVAGLFRAMHSIKGMAATMGYARLTDLTHQAEHLLDSVRAGRVPPSADLVALMFEVVDAIGAGVDDAVAGADGQRLDPVLAVRVAEMASGPAVKPVAPPGGGTLAEPQPGAGAGPWVTVTIRAGVVMGWARALLALRRAEELGTVSAVTPDPAGIEPDKFAGKLAFRLESAEPMEVVRAALMGVGDVAEVTVEDDGNRPAELSARSRPDVRVAREHLDRLMGEVGELVVARNRLAQMADERRDPGLQEAVGALSRLTDQVHEGVLQARMAPVSEVFDRFPRAIRDLARQVGKQVRLEVTGREVELDRSVLELIQDPLLHLLRNAVDHGLEDPATRTAAGKPAEGLVRLGAQRQREGVMITVADDGRGVDRDRVRKRLGEAAAAAGDLDDAGLLAVLARPGFSTAEAVTSVSGRGVGIDVVLTRIREIGGGITLRSTPGEGTSFSIRLPETMAVVPALLARVGSERYAIPLSRVEETGRAVLETNPVGGRAVRFRGEPLPARDLRAAVGQPAPPGGEVRPFLVVAVGEGRGVIVVDTLLGRQDLVVAAVELPLGAPGWITGAAVLPDGMPTFLLDPAGLFQEEVVWQR
ncbi:MAG: chemotaxis protein CheA [Gemmatimonadota bacterium]|nr:chemotaxis protein CheA [Gemmatimonadota bacterium]